MDVSLLIKFGKKEHLEPLLKEGLIYMRNIDYFRQYEAQQPKHLRGDRYEGYESISQNQTLFFPDTRSLIENITIWGTNHTFKGYIYCLYALFPSQSLNTIDNRMADFGEYALIIQNPNEFINRIKKYGEENNLFPNWDKVRYYDESKKNGLLTPFMKRSLYSYQSEARIYIHSKTPKEYFTFKLGSLEDIAYIVESSTLFNPLKDDANG